MSFWERISSPPRYITNTNYMLIVITVDYVRKEIKLVILDLTKVFSDVFHKSLFRHNFWIFFSLSLPVYRYSGCVTAVQFILFYFANYSPSIAMELKVGKEIACKWQNQRLETNKYVPWALFLKLQTAELNFEKLLGWTVFKNRNFNPFQSSSVLPIRGSCCICYFNLPLTF